MNAFSSVLGTKLKALVISQLRPFPLKFLDWIFNTTLLKEKLKREDDKLNQELEESYGDFDKIKLVFEKRIELYNRFLKEDTFSDMDMLTLTNKKEWTMSHFLNLIIEKELRDRLRDLTQRVYILEKAIQPDNVWMTWSQIDYSKSSLEQE